MYDDKYVELALATLQQTVDDYLYGWKVNPREKRYLSDNEMYRLVHHSPVIILALDYLNIQPEVYLKEMVARKQELVEGGMYNG